MLPLGVRPGVVPFVARHVMAKGRSPTHDEYEGEWGPSGWETKRRGGWPNILGIEPDHFLAVRHVMVLVS